MNVKDFFDIIDDSKAMQKGKYNTAYDVFEYSEINLSEEAIKSKLKNRRPQRCDLDLNIINENGFTNYFEQQTTRFTWKNIQSAFKKTDVAEFVDCNTNNAHEFFCSLLKLFYDVIMCVPVTFKTNLPITPLALGREKELAQIEQVLENNSCVFISGINGIGKTTLALSFASGLQQKGWKVQFINCETTDTFKNIINKLEFNNLDKDNFNNRLAILKKIMGPLLIIIDDYNYRNDDKIVEYIGNITKGRTDVKFLITGESLRPKELIPLIQLNSLEEKALLELYGLFRFEDGKNHSKYIREHKHSILKLLNLVDNHTLAVTLLAQTVLKTISTENEIYSIFYLTMCQQTGYDIYPREEDSNGLKKIIHIIFDFSFLKEDEKAIMTFMSMMPPSGVNIKLFCKLTNCKREKINSLKKQNMIIVNEESLVIRLHSLICDTILETDELKPTQEMGMSILEKKKELEDDPNKETECIQYGYSIEDYLNKLNQIAGSIISKVIFNSLMVVDNFNIVNLFKDKYKNSILLLNQAVAYTAHKDYLMDADDAFSKFKDSLKLHKGDDIDDNNDDDDDNDNNDLESTI